MDTLKVLNEVRLLGNHLDTYVEGVGVANDSQHDLSSMDVVLIL